jgi:hypothetical protein
VGRVRLDKGRGAVDKGGNKDGHLMLAMSSSIVLKDTP